MAMIGQLRAELLKQRSVQTTLYLFLAMFGLVALAVALHVLTLDADHLAARADQLDVFQVGSRAGMLFAGLAGAIAITAEIRYGTIRPTFLATPTRNPVIQSKLAVSGLVGILFGLLAEALMAGAAIVAFAARGIENQLTAGDYAQLLAGGAGAAALWAALGVGVGALVRNQVAVLVGLCAWMFLVESVTEGFVPGAARFMPGGLGLVLAGNSDELAAGVAALLLVLYAAAAAAAGWRATLRRDVA
jgi:ABC-type transport system involved in multi-copper enzyme maturation permease subunit